MITEAQKQKILAAIAANRANYPSDAKHAASLAISTSVYSAIKNGQTDKALSDANWISIARKLGVNLRGEMEWKAAKTPTFEYITAQLEFSAVQSVGHLVRHAQYRQDFHGTLLCAKPQECRLYRLLAGKDKIEVGTQDCCRVWCGQQGEVF